jgi:Arc/MetJ-type ribon-helix-helix transcriptional regulator
MRRFTEIEAALNWGRPEVTVRITICDTLRLMGRAISVRLDEEALQALRRLEAGGVSRSEAIRTALVDSAARLRDSHALRAEVQALESDPDDRREMLEVAELMESLRAPR